MLKFRLDDYESHGDGITFTMIAENVPENLVQYAKDIDDDNYCPSCFVTQITYYDDEYQFRVDTGTPDGTEFAYVDADGNWLGLDYEFSYEEIDQLIELAKDVLAKYFDFDYDKNKQLVEAYDELEYQCYELARNYMKLVGVDLEQEPSDWALAKEIQDSVIDLLELRFGVEFKTTESF